MRFKRLAACAALACLSLPAQAWDYREQDQPHTFIYMRIPLDGRSQKEQLPVWGLAVRGKREYQVLAIDTQMMSRFAELGFVESKIIMIGAVAAAGALAVAGAGSSSSATQQQQQQQQQQAAAAAAASSSPTSSSTSSTSTPPPAPCPRKPAC